MSNPTIRLLPYASADGAHNMAADETLLESAAAGAASLRFYGWSAPTVSLGYFQPERLRLQDDLVAPLPFVRRPTGGDALVHHHELTYALALPAGRPWQSAEPWTRRLHEVIALALNRFGVYAVPFNPDQCDRSGDLLCFRHFTCGDLMLGEHKIVGSAQRKQRQALMQHGGVLLAGSPHTPSLPGIHELTGRRIRVTELCDALLETFTWRTGWSAPPGEWTETERRRVEELVAAKYTRDAWNRKR